MMVSTNFPQLRRKGIHYENNWCFFLLDMFLTYFFNLLNLHKKGLYCITHLKTIGRKIRPLQLITNHYLFILGNNHWKNERLQNWYKLLIINSLNTLRLVPPPRVFESLFVYIASTTYRRHFSIWRRGTKSILTKPNKRDDTSLCVCYFV